MRKVHRYTVSMKIKRDKALELLSSKTAFGLELFEAREILSCGLLCT